MSIKKLDIKSVDSIINFLEQKGKNHKCYYHYTTWESLKKIMENKSFLLTRGNSLKINDQHEASKKGVKEVWDRTYIGSFAFGSSENMAMWGLYGLPWEDAIRIAIPSLSMGKWFQSIISAVVWDGDSKGKIIQNPETVLTDIMYITGNKFDSTLRLTHADKSKTISNSGPLRAFDETPAITGYVKNYAWHYENEVRLIIRLAEYINSEKLSIKIPDNILDTTSVTTGPYFKPKNDDLFVALHNQGRIYESGFKNLVNYRTLCSMCKHREFKYNT